MTVIYRSTLRWIGIGLVGVALLLGTVSIFFPWSQSDGPVFGDLHLEWGLLGGKVIEEGEVQEEWNWYDEYLEDDDERPLREHDGVPLLRIAIPFFFGGLLVSAAGPIIILMRHRITGALLTLAGGSLWLIVSILVAIGIGDFQSGLLGDFADRAMEIAPGQILAFIAAPLVIIGGALALTSTLSLGKASPEPGTTAPAQAAEDPQEPGPKHFRLQYRHRFR